MNNDDVPAYARIPNGPHEPNITPPGVVIVENSHKMLKTLMKMAKPKVKMKATHRSATRKVKWY